MKFSKLPLLLLGFGTLVFAQNQKYTMAEAVNGLRSNLAIKSILVYNIGAIVKINF